MNGKAGEGQEVMEDEREGRQMARRERKWTGRKINVRKGRERNGRKGRKMNEKEDKWREGKGNGREGR